MTGLTKRELTDSVYRKLIKAYVIMPSCVQIDTKNTGANSFAPVLQCLNLCMGNSPEFLGQMIDSLTYYGNPV